MRKPIIFIFILSCSLLFSFGQKVSGQDTGKDQEKDKLTIEEYKLFSDEDRRKYECPGLSCVPAEILEKRKKWRNLIRVARWRPQFLGEIIDVYSVDNTAEEKFEYASIEVKRGKKQVRLNDKAKYEFSIVNYPFDDALRDFYAYNNHWVLEYMDGKIKGRKVVDYPGTVVVDGVNLNKKYGFNEVFNFFYLNGRPFYFYRDDSRLVKLSYNDRNLLFKYEKVMHYACCSDGAYNRHWNNNMVWFFGFKEGFWYYVEIGVYK